MKFMKSLKVYGIAVVISILFVAPLKAQELDVDSLTGAIRSQGYREWKQTVADVKGQTRTLLDENESLKTEHAYLKDTYSMILEQNQDQKYKEWVRSRVDSLTGKLDLSLPTGFIHGDLFTDNVLIENGKFKAVIDFEDAGHNLLIFDIGMAVVGLCREDSKIRLLIDVLRMLHSLYDVYFEKM